MIVTPALAQTSEGAEAYTETTLAELEHHEEQVFPPFDFATFPSQILWLAITFGIFYLVMKRVIVPRVGSILEDRHDRIAQDLDEAERLRNEADAAIAAYEKELARARDEARSISAAAAEKARAEAEAERAELEAELGKKLSEANARIEKVRSEALAEVGTIAEDTAAQIVTHLIGGRVAKGDVEAAVSSAKEG
ncbi:F0F1 ATP synthase subunit B [Martelella radicis]|uniref:ATP synthase subunit b n=1 Tax=Martelella radicis TaxID=1397476 RepID=A0A7W6KKJ3_9HYPH|nr:F0F1 ATP synthase subunit B [Martelella radicis]MBB4122991.1 F-type H+-transporting ATPase subunit b [Martelella radicis]